MDMDPVIHQRLAELERTSRRLQQLVDHLYANVDVPPAPPEPTDGGLNTAERALVDAGKTLEALRDYRERTHADVQAAKAAIEAYARG